MMKFMNKKLTKKGFTLAELLIVVAILAILVAVSIPIFTSKLHDAKDSTDMANVRAAKAAAVVEYMSGTGNDAEGKGDAVTYYYDAANGKVVPATQKSTITKGYSQCTSTSCTKGGAATANAIVKVEIGANGAEVKATWEALS